MILLRLIKRVKTEQLRNMFQIKPATLTIDGQTTVIGASEKNLVELASRVGVRIPAPCLKNKRKHGCCKACLVEVGGQQTYACSSKPKSNTEVIVKRRDLDQIRKASLQNFKQQVKSGDTSSCGCSC